jgi:hypothetical protein
MLKYLIGHYKIKRPVWKIKIKQVVGWEIGVCNCDVERDKAREPLIKLSLHGIIVEPS